jgi:hypothetical protein
MLSPVKENPRKMLVNMLLFLGRGNGRFAAPGAESVAGIAGWGFRRLAGLAAGSAGVLLGQVAVGVRGAGALADLLVDADAHATAMVVQRSLAEDRRDDRVLWRERSLGVAIPRAVHLQQHLADQRRALPGGDVDKALDEAVDATTVNAALVKPVSVGELIAVTLDPDGTEITLSHKQGCSISLAGTMLTDSDPGAKGRTAVEFDPGLLTFSVTYRDTDLDDVSGEDLAQQLFARNPATLQFEFQVLEGATANTKIALANAKFTRGPRRSPARGFTEYTVEGQCNWADSDGTIRTLGGANKLITVTKATFPP